VYRSTSGATPTAVGDTTANTYIDDTAVNDTTYDYTVVTLNAAGESAPSTATTATPTAPATGVPTNGLVLGLDATDLAASLANGDPVSLWTGVGTPATGSATARPTFVTSGIGGQPSVRFDGVNDALVLGAGFEDFTSGFTTFVVANSTELQRGFKIVALGNGAGSNNVVLGRAGDTDRLQFFTNDSSGRYGWFNTNPAVVVNQPQLISVAQPGGTPNSTVTAVVSVNGVQVGSGATYVPPVVTRATNYIGQSFWNEGRFAGDIAEVLVYNRTLTPAETSQVTNYLNAKYFSG